MHSFSDFAVSSLVNAAWEVVVIFAAAWLASRMLRRLGPQAEHVVWVFALLGSVVAPVLPAIRKLTMLFPGPSSANLHLSIIAADQGFGPANVGAFQLPAGWCACLLDLYAGCLLIFTARLLLSLLGVVRLLRGARPATLAPEQDEIWRGCRKTFALPDARLLSSEHVASPVALGLRLPVLLLPGDFPDRCTLQDFHAAIVHECAHLSRRDFQKNLFYEMASLVLAFHPLTWVMKARIAQTREMICDSMVTEKCIDAHSYARSLLRLAAMVAVPRQPFNRYAVGIFDGGILEKRIMHITIRKKQAGALVKYALILPSALLLAVTLASAAAMAVVIEAQPPAQTAASRYGHVYKVGNGVSAPVPLNSVEAQFPKSGHYAKGFHAIVIVGLVVDAAGMPRDPQVTRSYNQALDAQAIKAVKHYRFKPAMRAGKPVPVAIHVEINFKMY